MLKVLMKHYLMWSVGDLLIAFLLLLLLLHEYCGNPNSWLMPLIRATFHSWFWWCA